MFKKIWNWIIQNGLLIASVGVPLLIIVLRALICDFEKLIEEHIGLAFYQLMVLTGAILTLLWTDKRYKQAQDSIFLNKINSIYLETVNTINKHEFIEENKKTQEGNKKPRAKITNLINSIQSQITAYYQDNPKQQKRSERKPLTSPLWT